LASRGNIIYGKQTLTAAGGRRFARIARTSPSQAIGKRLDGAPIEPVIAAKIVEAAAEGGYIRDRYLDSTAPA
jgi:hypothetical protein